jgi:hypothetical protein
VGKPSTCTLRSKRFPQYRPWHIFRARVSYHWKQQGNFVLKILTILMYGLEILWECPAENSLKTLDKEQRDMVQVLLHRSYNEQTG